MDEEIKDAGDFEELSEEGRRSFLTKAATVAAAGLVGGLIASEANAQPRTGVRVGTLKPMGTVRPVQKLTQTPLQYQKLAKGHQFNVRGAQLGGVLSREGLIDKAHAGKAAVMSLSLNWD